MTKKAKSKTKRAGHKAPPVVAPIAKPLPPPTFDNFVAVTTNNPNNPGVADAGWVNMDHVILIRPNADGGSSLRLINNQVYDINESPSSTLKREV